MQIIAELFFCHFNVSEKVFCEQVLEQAWVGYISIGYISGIYIQRPDIWCGYISSFQIGYLDISWYGYGYWIFLLYIISIWAAGYRIWIYIQFLPSDMDRILYPKKVDMTQAWLQCTNFRISILKLVLIHAWHMVGGACILKSV